MGAIGDPLLPSTGIAAVDWVIYAGAVIAALALIWTKAIKPTMRAFASIDEYGPVIAEIAKQFKNNSGSSLKDTLDRLEANTTSLAASVKRLESRLKEKELI